MGTKWSEVPVGISYSGGTSSEWPVEAVIRGEIKRPSLCAVFFADTGEEHGWTYDAVNEVEERCRSAGLRFIRCRDQKETLGDHMVNAVANGATRMDQVPFWIDTGNGRGKVPQRCTERFKLAPIRRAQWRWLASMGMPKQIVSWIGFGADEMTRAQKAVAKRTLQWQRLDFPAIRLGRTREMQQQDLIASVGRAPRFSACVICPYKDPGRWAATSGRELSRAAYVDSETRDLTQFDLTNGPAYLSDSLIPVSRLVNGGNPDVPREPNPGCDAGACFV